MPTDRFYRLPEEKKVVIREAAVKEFVRVLFDKASINQIIQSAGISRGSFYTYFEDKLDLLEFVFADVSDRMRERCEEYLQESGGDFFAMLNTLFEFMVERLQMTKDMLMLAKNVFPYHDNAMLFWRTRWDDDNRGRYARDAELPYRWLWERIDRNSLNCENAEDMIPLMTLGISSVMFSVKQYYEHPDKLDGIRNQFGQMLTLLKIGALKEKS